MDELKLDQDPDNKRIQIDSNSAETNLTIKNEENTMLGVELLANQKNNKADLSVTDSIGYSSGEDNVKSDKNITPNEDYDFFHQVGDDNINIQLKEEQGNKDPEIKTIHAPLPQDDPIKRCPSISRANELLKWQPSITLEQGLVKTIQYFEGLLIKQHSI